MLLGKLDQDGIGPDLVDKVSYYSQETDVRGLGFAVVVGLSLICPLGSRLTGPPYQ